MACFWIHEDELTLLEHNFLNEQNAVDFPPEKFQWYWMGVHDFVERLILEMNKEKEN